MTSTRHPNKRRRYSIGEWYGAPLEKLTPTQWTERAKTEITLDALTGTACPFQANATCSKKGGVCSLRLYEQVSDGPVGGIGPLITTCPLRFLEGGTIFRWIGETILQTSDPIVLSEIGFLDRLRPELEPDSEAEDSSVKALTGGVPLPKEEFEKQLRHKLRLVHPDHPLAVG